MIGYPEPSNDDRLAQLLEVEKEAMRLLDAIEERGFILPGRSEREVERDILALARDEFGVRRHWHKRIVRCGANTLSVSSDSPPVLTIAEDDIVFLDIGPVFGDWEADVGRSYVIGDDPAKRTLCTDLTVQFDALQAHYLARPDIIGADLFEFARLSAERAGWRFGGTMAGHIVGEFPHAHLPGEKDGHRIAPENRIPMSAPDAFGRARYWIGEIHLTAPDCNFGGFYERLLHPSVSY